MLSRNSIKRVKSLQQKKFRNELGLFIAEGTKLVDELISSNFEIEEIYHTEQYLVTNVNCLVHKVSQSEMERISGLVTPSPVLAVVRFPTYKLDVDPSKELVLALDTIQDPGNMGTIIRLADWFGIDNIVCSHGCADAFAPKAIQATMGAIAHVKVHYTDLITWLSQHTVNCPIIGACMDGENIYKAKKEHAGIIVMGNEGNGISPAVDKLITHRIHIPTFARGRQKVESLNVAMATAIILSEFKGTLHQ
ncbi:MAG TPA: RNA methyltransferase [Tenuifilum sp.]|uniref:TrmH family RNA methyltransferase n=1 Tax=Tenuifilum sp. TaxID=2760880 RepID=UPI001B44EBB3|nr:RNA methyltransferase [Bacteroidales bacterium]HOU74776.1 RNA methyltransferase [Tenuifilum sp.]